MAYLEGGTQGDKKIEIFTRYIDWDYTCGVITHGSKIYVREKVKIHKCKNLRGLFKTV